MRTDLNGLEKCSHSNKKKVNTQLSKHNIQMKENGNSRTANIIIITACIQSSPPMRFFSIFMGLMLIQEVLPILPEGLLKVAQLMYMG